MFFFNPAKFVLWHKQQRKILINKTREAIDKKGLKVSSKRKNEMFSRWGKRSLFNVVQGTKSRAKEEEKLGE